MNLSNSFVNSVISDSSSDNENNEIKEITISILRSQKDILIGNLDNTENLKEKNEILNNIFMIDTKLNEYIKKINNNELIEKRKINDDNDISKEKEEKKITINNQINNKDKNNNKIIKEIDDSKIAIKKNNKSKNKKYKKLNSNSSETNKNKIKKVLNYQRKLLMK